MSEWMLLLLLATGEQRFLPASPAICMAWVTHTALGNAPVYNDGGVDVPVVFALCTDTAPRVLGTPRSARPDARSTLREGLK